jgi:hypothetical protein
MRDGVDQIDAAAARRTNKGKTNVASRLVVTIDAVESE